MHTIGYLAVQLLGQALEQSQQLKTLDRSVQERAEQHTTAYGVLLSLLQKEWQPLPAHPPSPPACPAVVAAAATQVARMLLIPATSLPTLSASALFRDSAVSALIAALTWPGSSSVRLAAAEALRQLAGAALCPPPLLIDRTRDSQREVQETQRQHEEHQAQRNDRRQQQATQLAEETLAREGFRVRLVVSESAYMPISFALEAPAVARPNSPELSSECSAEIVQDGGWQGSSAGESGSHGDGCALLQPQQLARMAAAAADALSDVEPAVADAAKTLLSRLAAPAALLAASSAASAEMEEAAWRIEVGCRLASACTLFRAAGYGFDV